MGAHRATGFTIIEVLVAVLVLAFGVVGGAAMQLAALRTRHQSALLSNAVQLASAMADSMRANAEQMRSADHDNAYLGLDYDTQNYAQSDASSPVNSGTSCFSAITHCNSVQLASFDIDHWQRQLKNGFPGGRFVICRDVQVLSGSSSRLNWACVASPAAPIVIKLGWQSADSDPMQRGTSGTSATSGVMLALTLIEAAR
jgi:type IV pilus assembly protein PilV